MQSLSHFLKFTLLLLVLAKGIVGPMGIHIFKVIFLTGKFKYLPIKKNYRLTLQKDCTRSHFQPWRGPVACIYSIQLCTFYPLNLCHSDRLNWHLTFICVSLFTVFPNFFFFCREPISTGGHCDLWIYFLFMPSFCLMKLISHTFPLLNLAEACFLKLKIILHSVCSLTLHCLVSTYSQLCLCLWVWVLCEYFTYTDPCKPWNSFLLTVCPPLLCPQQLLAKERGSMNIC